MVDLTFLRKVICFVYKLKNPDSFSFHNPGPNA